MTDQIPREGNKMNIPRIENMDGKSGKVANQFIIRTEEGSFFQSYSTVIAFRPFQGRVVLDRASWDYSNTTGKYRNQFLHETKAETEKKIKQGEYELADLNG
jgi:hypothetical protein